MPAALTLAIEASNPSIPSPGVALGEGDGAALTVLDTEPVRPATRTDDDLTCAVDRLFARCGRSVREVARVAVSVGPGGYTSMRMAVAAGKMIAEAVGARCVPVPSALVIAWEARERGLPLPLLILMAGKGDTAFGVEFPDAGELSAARGRVLGAPDLERLRPRAIVADEHLPDALRQAAARSGVPVHAPRLDARACLHASAGLAGIDPAALVPIYAREPEAVTRWREQRR